MAKFEPALQLVLQNEGGFSNNPKDSGGATNLGISLRLYKKCVKPDADIDDIKKLTVSDATDIYRKLFWDRAPFADINSQNIANKLFDLSVNMGTPAAVKCLQVAINDIFRDNVLVEDGVLGPRTINMINNVVEPHLYAALLKQARVHYDFIVKNNPQYKIFLQGWVKRLHSALIV